MKLRYYIDKKSGKKIYTLKESVKNKPTNPAHYKFIQLKPKYKKIKTISPAYLQ